MQKRNNLLLISAIALIVFLCTIPMTWFVLFNATSSLGGQWPVPLTVTGIAGTLAVPFPTPIWLLLVISACATLITTLNIAAVTSIPRAVPAIVLLLCGVCYALPLCYAAFSSGTAGQPQLHAGAGPILALLDTLLMLGITMIAGRSLGSEPADFRDSLIR